MITTEQPTDSLLFRQENSSKCIPKREQLEKFKISAPNKNEISGIRKVDGCGGEMKALCVI